MHNSRQNPKGITTSVYVSGRRWFDRTYGNTYFSATGRVNGKLVHQIDFEYGYGDHYLYRMVEDLIKAGHLPPLDGDALWQWSEKHFINLESEVADVSRKRDLHGR